MTDLKKTVTENFNVIKNNWFMQEAENIFGQPEASYNIVKDIINCNTAEQLFDLLKFFADGSDIDLAEFIGYFNN